MEAIGSDPMVSLLAAPGTVHLAEPGTLASIYENNTNASEPMEVSRSTTLDKIDAMEFVEVVYAVLFISDLFDKAEKFVLLR